MLEGKKTRGDSLATSGIKKEPAEESPRINRSCKSHEAVRMHGLEMGGERKTAASYELCKAQESRDLSATGS